MVAASAVPNYWQQIESAPIHSPVAALTHVYGGRYELQASLRSDFILKNEYSRSFQFLGGAARLYMHKESFLQDVSFLSAFTLQADLGYTTNLLFNPYFARLYGYGRELAPDRTTHFDAGVHSGLFGNKLTLDTIVYHRRTADAQTTLNYQVPIVEAAYTETL